MNPYGRQERTATDPAGGTGISLPISSASAGSTGLSQPPTAHLFLCNPLLTLQSYSPLPRFQAVCRPFTPEHALFSCNSVTQLMATFPLFTCAPSSPDIPDVLLLHHLAANWTPTAQPDSQKHFWSQGLPCLLSVNRKSCIPDISLTDGISNSNF